MIPSVAPCRYGSSVRVDETGAVAVRAGDIRRTLAVLLLYAVDLVPAPLHVAGANARHCFLALAYGTDPSSFFFL